MFLKWKLAKLIKNLRRTDSVRNDAAIGLEKFGALAVTPLIEILNDPREEVEMRRIAARVLGNIGDECAINALAIVLENPIDIRARLLAASTLIVIASPMKNCLNPRKIQKWCDLNTVPSLIAACSNPDSNIRLESLRILEGCEGVPLQPLLKVLDDPDPSARAAAVRVVATIRNSEVRQLLASKLDDLDNDVQEEALIGLGHLKDEMSVSILINKLQRGGSGRLCGPINESLRDLGWPEKASLPLLIETLKSKQFGWLVAAKTLGSRKWQPTTKAESDVYVEATNELLKEEALKRDEHSQRQRDAKAKESLEIEGKQREEAKIQQQIKTFHDPSKREINIIRWILTTCNVWSDVCVKASLQGVLMKPRTLTSVGDIFAKQGLLLATDGSFNPGSLSLIVDSQHGILMITIGSGGNRIASLLYQCRHSSSSVWLVENERALGECVRT